MSKTLISDHSVTIKLGNKVILLDSTIVINENQHYAIVGPNGCGKSTLLDYIKNVMPPLINVYKVEQHIVFDTPEQTVLDFMLHADEKIYKINQKVLELENNEHMIDELFEEYELLINTTEYIQYDKYLSETKKILNGLGILDLNTKLSNYSGGWRMRLSIARALISKPDVLLMDEPTNHLDLNAVIWLGNYLSNYKKTLIIVSHQIDFINNFSNIIMYIGNPDFTINKLYIINGGYDKLLKTLSDIHTNCINNYKKYITNLDKLKKTKNITKKQIDEFIKLNFVPKPEKPYEVKITLPDVGIIRDISVVRFENVTFKYGEINILENIEYSIFTKSRHCIVGKNGAGKTTLFKLCQEIIKPNFGEILKDSRVKTFYYNQQIIESLPLHLNPIQYLQTIDTDIDVKTCRSYLGKLGLKKINNIDPCILPIENLSGGQKARVLFSSLQISSPNVILFDEPTNHLDIESIEGLIEGINEYNGAIIIITHDTYLISKIKNMELFEINDKSVHKLNYDYKYYVESIINS